MAYRTSAHASWLLASLFVAGGCFAEPDPVADTAGSTTNPNSSSTTGAGNTSSGPGASGVSEPSTGIDWSTGLGTSSGGDSTGWSTGASTVTGELDTEGTDTGPVPGCVSPKRGCPGGTVCCDVEGLGCYNSCVPMCTPGDCNVGMICADAFCHPACTGPMDCPRKLTCQPGGYCDDGPGAAETGADPGPVDR